MIFRRVEKKYRLTPAKHDTLLDIIRPHLVPDAHGLNTIVSLYLDTPDHRIIRASIGAKVYKEKLRVRSYGIPVPGEPVFLEIKKKYKGVVYKRRIRADLDAVMAYVTGGERPEESQIMQEIDHAMHFWQQPGPAMMICYEREAYFVPDIPTLRITFDRNARWRETELDLMQGTAGTLLLPKDVMILEVKTDGAMPLWLSHALDQCGLTPVSFSKYGAAYLAAHGIPAPSVPHSIDQGGLVTRV